ncbi:MAG: hypothetical protein SNJ70_05950 [Armatimonadota bacterium]
MKFIVYSFVILVLAIMGIGAGLEGTNNKTMNESAAIDTVYVDISKLLVLHPSYKYVKAYIESEKEYKIDQGKGFSIDNGQLQIPALDSFNIDLSERERLANLTVLRAISSLQELEYVTKENLTYCITAEKGRVADRQWSSICKEADNILKEANKKAVDLQRDSLSDKFNAQIALAAAISASNYCSLTFDNSKLLETRNRFESINDRIIARNKEFLAEAENKIAMLKESSKECPVIKTFDNVDCSYIKNIINTVQDNTTKELSIFENKYFDIHSKFISNSDRNKTPFLIDRQFSVDSKDIKLDGKDNIGNEMISLIEKDIRRELRRISQSRNINITYTYSSGIKDGTQYFYKLMKSDGECVFRPVMSEAFGGHS